MLELNSLRISYQNETIVKGVSLKVRRGETVILMGPNGSGKSTLASALAGNPQYEITAGTIEIDNEDVTGLAPNERAEKGLFLAFQNPVSVPGVSLTKLLREISPEAEKQPGEFIRKLRQFAKELNFAESLLIRGLNDGFSGGEKKKIEMVQAYFLAKKYVVFDEIDTGLDVDALKKIADLINELKADRKGVLIITHYHRLVEFLDVDKVLVMNGGKIVKEGGKSLVKEIENKGYGHFV